MPSYMVSKDPNPATGDLGGTVMVTAPDEHSAKEDGARLLGTSPVHVTAQPFPNAAWNELKSQ